VQILPRAIDALSGFQREGFKIVVVTNQSAVGRGLLSLQTAQDINDRLVKIIRESSGWVDAVYMCPHKPEDQCNCRKPKPGLLLQAAQDLSLDLQSSWMVGDAWSDLIAGQAAGLRGTIMVRTGRGASQFLETQPEDLEPFLVSNDLYDAFHTVALLQKNKS
jgi:D-glycero-D-manno-heptose 1,7-bisphosphate phosphatase